MSDMIREALAGLAAPGFDHKLHRKALDELARLERELAAARQALAAYHVLVPALADCANECGEQLLYTDLYAANRKADAALASPSGEPHAKPLGKARLDPDAPAGLNDGAPQP